MPKCTFFEPRSDETHHTLSGPWWVSFCSGKPSGLTKRADPKMKRIRVLQPREYHSQLTTTYEQTKEIVTSGLAKWEDRCKTIRLTTYAKALRGESCKPDARTSFDYAIGEKRAIAIIEGWYNNAETLNVRKMDREMLTLC